MKKIMLLSLLILITALSVATMSAYACDPAPSPTPPIIINTDSSSVQGWETVTAPNQAVTVFAGSWRIVVYSPYYLDPATLQAHGFANLWQSYIMWRYNTFG